MFALSKSILVTSLAAAGALALSACGQKGDLYLPPPQAAAAPKPAPAAPPSAASSPRQP